MLNPNFTLEEFVVGPNSRFAYSAALAVIENPGKRYNPLFIYGGVGLGKTHLMQAIGNEVKKRVPDAKVEYITAKDFMDKIIESIEKGNIVDLTNKYKQIDLLLVDDIQFLAASESTQEEFFHIFNELHNSRKQIVLTSDRPPKLLTTLEDRLKSRFEWGLITDIKQPPLETRVAILRRKSELENIVLDENILLYVAQILKSNVRELEGFLKRISAYALITDQKIDMELVESIMKELLPPEEVAKMSKKETVPEEIVSQMPQPQKIYTAPPKPTKVTHPKPPLEEIVKKQPVAPTPPEEDKSLRPIEIAFFYPEGKFKELSKAKEKFREIIKKYKLKFRLTSVFDKEYSLQNLNYAMLVDLCKTNNIKTSVVIGPPSDTISNEEFYNSILPLMEAGKISLQYIPWNDLNKDYRYLNLALDIALTMYNFF